jgi:hypothetical protein
MRQRSAALVVMTTLGSAAALFGQAPAPKEDETPFTRPEPLCTMAASDPAALLKKVRAFVESEGYTIDRISAVSGELGATRPDGRGSDDYDKVIIWIERDLNRPQDALKLFLVYGRYEKVWGNTVAVRRIKVDSVAETARNGSLRKKLLAMAEGGD